MVVPLNLVLACDKNNYLDTLYSEEVGHALSAAKLFSLNVRVPGCYIDWYSDIQSVSHNNYYWVEKG